MSEKVTFNGSPLTLAGRVLKKGAIAPDFKAVSVDLKETGLSDFEGKIKVITSFLSLDTRVCDLQVKEFNKRAASLSSDVVVLGVSKDLPFAQKRFCEANNIKNALMLSDYKFSSFGINYGLLIKEMNLIARAALILDKNNVLRYRQMAQEQTGSLDYEDVLKNLEAVIKNSSSNTNVEPPVGCKPCEGVVAALPQEKTKELLGTLTGWQLVENKKIVREFKFKDFTDAKYFLDLVSIVAQEQAHHPNFLLSYGKLKVTLTTHAAQGLTENDFIMARIIDELAG